MKDKNDDFDLDEYIKRMEEEDKELLSVNIPVIPNEPFPLSEEDRRLIALEKQIFSEREKEDEYVKKLSPEEQEEYLRKKYEIAEELAKLNKTKTVKLTPKKKKE